MRKNYIHIGFVVLLLVFPRITNATLNIFTDLQNRIVVYDDIYKQTWMADLSAYTNQTYEQQLASVDSMNNPSDLFYGIDGWRMATHTDMLHIWDNYTADQITQAFLPSEDQAPNPPKKWAARADHIFPNPNYTMHYRPTLDNDTGPIIKYPIHDRAIPTSYSYPYVGAWIVTDASPFLESVNIDIKPRSCPNPINLKSQGVLPVAILGTEDFDVTEIDVSTISLEGVAPVHTAYEDVSTTLNGMEECECTELNGDSIDDLTLKFRTQDIVDAALDGVNPGDEVILVLTATLLDGSVIKVSDCVVVVGRKNNK
jgi:hypothetical protein